VGRWGDWEGRENRKAFEKGGDRERGFGQEMKKTAGGTETPGGGGQGRVRPFFRTEHTENKTSNFDSQATCSIVSNSESGREAEKGRRGQGKTGWGLARQHSSKEGLTGTVTAEKGDWHTRIAVGGQRNTAPSPKTHEWRRPT